jgi:hypothetical protein
MDYVPTLRELRRHLVDVLVEEGEKDIGSEFGSFFTIGNLRPNLQMVEINAAVLRYYSDRGFDYKLASGLSDIHLFRKNRDKRTDTSVWVSDYEPEKRVVSMAVHRVGWRPKSLA